MNDKPNRLPIQPLYMDDHGTWRFRENKIVRYLLDHGGLDLNKLTIAVQNCPEDWEQFAQLIGYSLSGFSELSYVSEETYAAASGLAANPELSETESRLLYLQAIVDGVRDDLRTLVPRLFRIHPDDLKE